MPHDFDLSHFHFDSNNMNADDMLKLLSQIVVAQMLKLLEVELPALLCLRYPDEAGKINWDYIDRMACTAYGMAITLPFALIRMMGGLVEIAHIANDGSRSHSYPERLTRKLQKGFSQISPTFSRAITQDIVIKTARLCLFDWLKNGTDDKEMMQMDTQLYLHTVLDMDTDQDETALRREAKEMILNMSPDDLADIDPDLINQIRNWQPEDDERE